MHIQFPPKQKGFELAVGRLPPSWLVAHDLLPGRSLPPAPSCRDVSPSEDGPGRHRDVRFVAGTLPEACLCSACCCRMISVGAITSVLLSLEDRQHQVEHKRKLAVRSDLSTLYRSFFSSSVLLRNMLFLSLNVCNSFLLISSLPRCRSCLSTPAYDILNRKLFSLPKLLLLPRVISRQPLLLAKIFPFILLTDVIKGRIVASVTDRVERFQREARDVDARRRKVEQFDMKNAELVGVPLRDLGDGIVPTLRVLACYVHRRAASASHSLSVVLSREDSCGARARVPCSSPNVAGTS